MSETTMDIKSPPRTQDIDTESQSDNGNVAVFRELLEATNMAKQSAQATAATRPESALTHTALASLGGISPNMSSLTTQDRGNGTGGGAEKVDSNKTRAPTSSEPLVSGQQSPASLGGISDVEARTSICGGVPPPYSPQSERSNGSNGSNGSTSANAPQQFCLRWNNYQSNLTSVFDQLLQNESFVDVTLACDGRSIKAHKMVLSACSPYFQTLFSTTPCTHPIVIMRDVNWRELKSIVDFMYKGEINVCQDQIGPLLRIAEMLKVRGLADVGSFPSTSSAVPHNIKQEITTEKEIYSPQSLSSSPKRRKTSSSPYDGSKRPQSRCPTSETQRQEQNPECLSTEETEKKSHLDSCSWDLHLGRDTPKSNLELRLSPLQHQHLLGRNVRKRRWPSADAVFNPPESPLSSLIAAERAEQERERDRARDRDRDKDRERDRDRERERARDRERERTLFTPPMPVITGSAGSISGLGSSMTSSNVMESSSHMDFPSPSPTPMPSLLGRSRTPGSIIGSSPHLQISAHQAHHHHQHHHHQLQQQQQQQQQQQHPHQQHQQQQQQLSQQHHLASGLQSHRASPASSVTSTHPSSILSRPLTPSSAGTGPGIGYSLGPAQAAAMAAAAAATQMDLSSSSSMGGMRSLPTTSQGSSHHPPSMIDDLEIKPGIAEMIREEERVSQHKNYRMYNLSMDSWRIAALRHCST